MIRFKAIKFIDKFKILLDDGRHVIVPASDKKLGTIKHGDVGTFHHDKRDGSIRLVVDSEIIDFTPVKTPDIIPTPKRESRELICVS